MELFWSYNAETTLTAGVSGDWRKPPTVSFLFRIMVRSPINYGIRILSTSKLKARRFHLSFPVYNRRRVILQNHLWLDKVVLYICYKCSRGKYRTICIISAYFNYLFIYLREMKFSRRYYRKYYFFKRIITFLFNTA